MSAADYLTVDNLKHVIYPTPLKLAATAVAAFAIPELWKLYKALVQRPRASPLRFLPGPETRDSILWGHLSRLLARDYVPIFEEWFEKYGHVLQYRGFMGVSRAVTERSAR